MNTEAGVVLVNKIIRLIRTTPALRATLLIRGGVLLPILTLRAKPFLQFSRHKLLEQYRRACVAE
jgi:hypothetical protein